VNEEHVYIKHMMSICNNMPSKAEPTPVQAGHNLLLLQNISLLNSAADTRMWFVFISQL
jgi:hypothetical protein